MTEYGVGGLSDVRTELDGFEVWDRAVHAPAGQGKKVAYVSVRRGGVIGANQAVGEMLGWPEAVKVLFDPKRRRLGLLPTVLGDENSFETGWRGGPPCPGTFQISCKKLLDYYGIDVTERRRYQDLQIIDGILVVDL